MEINNPKVSSNNLKIKKSVKKIIYSFKPKGGFWRQDLVLVNHSPFEYIDSIVKIKYLTDSINYKSQYLSNFKKYSDERNVKFKELISRGLRNDSYEVEAAINGLASVINITSTRLKHKYSPS